MDDKIQERAQPFFFFSYARANGEVVQSEVSWMRDAGFDIWFDQGMYGGVSWRQQIADGIQSSDGLIFFASKQSIDSENCLWEIEFAQNQNRPLLVIYLEEVDLPSRLSFLIGGIQSVNRFDINHDAYREAVMQAVANIQSVLSIRQRLGSPPLHTNDTISKINFDTWSLDLPTGHLSNQESNHHLEPKTAEVLLLLAQNSGEVVSRETFITTIWAGRFVTDDALNRCIKDLRHVLKDTEQPRRYIETFPKRGYSLICTAELIADGA